MKCKLLHIYGSWEIVLDSCRTTLGKCQINKTPSLEWINKMLYAEHSPIRLIQFHIKWEDLPWYVHTHIVRHTIGTWQQDQLDFVQSSREDITGVSRDRSQNDLVNYEATFNLQSIINISRKRLCNKTSTQTMEAWYLMLDVISEKLPEIKHFCVPECVYRGFCSEVNGCKRDFVLERIEYLELNNNLKNGYKI